MPVVTRSMSAAAAMKKRNVLYEMLRKRPKTEQDRRRCDDYLMSIEGGKDMLCLDNEFLLLELWAYVLSPVDDGGETGGPSYSRPMIERLLECISSEISISPHSRDWLASAVLDAMSKPYEDDVQPWSQEDAVSEDAPVMPEDLMLRIIDKNPGRIIDIPDDNGNFFLHKLMHFQSSQVSGNGVSLTIIKHIYNAFPDAIKHKNHGGSLPLHEIFNGGLYRPTALKVQCIEFLLSKYPRAASMTAGDMGNLSLHLLARSATMWTYKDDKDKDLALALLKIIYDAYPDAVKIRNANSEYPLHMACKDFMKDTPMACYFLMQKFPQAVFEKNDGFTPFDYFSIKYDNIDKSISYFVEGLKKYDLVEYVEAMRDERTGDNLLHLLSKYNVVEAMSNGGASMSLLLFLSKNSCDVHWSNRKRLIRELVWLFPRLTLEENLNGDLPLHVRLRSRDKYDLVEDVKMLVDAMDQARDDDERSYPLVTPSHQNGLLPFMVAAGKEDTPSVSCTFMLLQRFVAERDMLRFDFSCPEEQEETRKSKRQRLTK